MVGSSAIQILTRQEKQPNAVVVVVPAFALQQQRQDDVRFYQIIVVGTCIVLLIWVAAYTHYSMGYCTGPWECTTAVFLSLGPLFTMSYTPANDADHVKRIPLAMAVQLVILGIFFGCVILQRSDLGIIVVCIATIAASSHTMSYCNSPSECIGTVVAPLVWATFAQAYMPDYSMRGAISSTIVMSLVLKIAIAWPVASSSCT